MHNSVTFVDAAERVAEREDEAGLAVDVPGRGVARGVAVDHALGLELAHDARVRRHAAELVVDEALELVAELLRVLSTVSASLSVNLGAGRDHVARSCR